MDQTIYTQENWTLFLKTLAPSKNEAYVILSEVIGINAESIKNQSSKSKALPTWARALIFAFKNSVSPNVQLIIYDDLKNKMIESLNSFQLTPQPVDPENQNAGTPARGSGNQNGATPNP